MPPNSIAISPTRVKSFFSSATGSVGPMRTPRRPSHNHHCSRSAFQRANGRISARSRPTGSSSAYRHSSRTTSRCLMRRRIHFGLEGSDADATEGIEEPFLFLPMLDENIDDAFDGLGDVGVRDGRADHLAERRVVAAGRTAEGDLVPLLAVLIHAENADVADRVMAAAIHAARHLQLDLAEVVQVIEIVETFVDLLGERNRARVRERA